MGNGYSVTAFDYNKEDIGIDPETNTKFVPNEKELELFKKEKMNLYKGTWTVCFVYGISAFILLVIVLFTDMGRNYIYNKYFPAVMTYVIGAIIIIIYLIYSIFNIKPRKLGKAESKSSNCPDYWSYIKEDIKKTEGMVLNMKYNNNSSPNIILSTIEDDKKIKKGTDNQQYILNNKDDLKLDVGTSNLFIDYKCKADENIYGTIDEQKLMKNNLYGDNMFNEAYKKKDTNKKEYLINNLGQQSDTDNEVVTKLKKYAQISGIYKNKYDNISHLSEHSLRKDSSGVSNTFYNEVPLICNEVYPNLLSKLEEEGSNDIRCAYADKCKISWSDIDCYKNKDVKLKTT
jgi:hypothetical protein